MGHSAIVITVTVAYLAASLLAGTLPGRKMSATATGYVAGDRSLGLLLMYFITGATIFSAFAFLGAPGWTYKRGVAACYILGYGTFGFIPFYFLGPRAARVGRAFGFVTQAEMVAKRFNSRKLQGTMALISVIVFIPYLAIQIKGAGYVLSAVTDGALPQWAGGAIVYGVVLVYVLRSGVLGVGWTNTLQGIFMLVLAWTLGIYLPTRLYGGIGEMFSQIANARPALLEAPGLAKSGAVWPWSGYSSAVLVSAVGFSCWPHLFMKAFTARDEQTIRRTVLLYPTFQLFLVPLFLIGFAGVLFKSAPAQADQILPHMLISLELPPLIVGLFCAGALAASMSSGDAMVHAAASIFVRDLWVGGMNRSLDESQQRRAIRWAVVVLMLVSYLAAVLYRGSLVALLLSTYGAVVQFAPIVFATLYSKRVQSSGALAGLSVGAALTIAFTLFPDARPFEIHAGAFGLTANIGAMLLLSKPHAEQDDFLKIAAAELPATAH